MDAMLSDMLRMQPSESKVDDLRTFDVRNFPKNTYDPAWERHKTLGNESYAAREYTSAIKHYTNALSLALGYRRGGAGMAFDETLAATPPASAAYRLHDNNFAVSRILSYLPFVYPPIKPADLLDAEVLDPETEAVDLPPIELPNLPAATCLANRSAAHLANGSPKKALEDAERACKMCPAYVKGHFRRKQAHTALQNREAASEIAEEISDYNKLYQKLPYPGAPLLVAGFIDWMASTIVYAEMCTKEGISRCRAARATVEPDTFAPIALTPSLVSFQDCQILVMGLRYYASEEGETVQRKIDCISFDVTDFKNGDDLDLPPHGLPSESSRKAAPMLIARMAVRLGENNLELQSINLGQGLIEMEREVEAACAAAGCKPSSPVVVSNLSTAASEDAHLTEEELRARAEAFAAASPEEAVRINAEQSNPLMRGLLNDIMNLTTG